MNNLSINSFTFGVKPIRVAIRDGEPWFGAADVCGALDLGNVSQALSRLDQDEKGVISNDTPGGTQGLLHVSESGLYSLVLGSRKQVAKKFKRWITSEVLPSIRKTGAYAINPEVRVPQTLSEALRMAADQAEKIEALGCTVQAQAQDIQVLEPMAAAAQALTQAQDSQSFDQAAKVLGTGPNRLFTQLRTWKWIKPYSTLPYQDQVDNGNFIVKEILYKDAHGLDRISPKTFITGKGLVAIQKRMASETPSPIIRPQHRG